MKSSSLLLLSFFILISCNNDSSAPKVSKDTSPEVRFPEILTHADSLDQGLLRGEDSIKGSPYQTASEEWGNELGTVKIKMGYSSPGVKGRIIWGGLVPYDKVWVTGAHQATWIQWNKKVWIRGKEIPAGKYALFTIPGRNKWTIIINKRYDQHLADEYNEKEDLVRFEVTPEKSRLTERLTYTIENLDDVSCRITMQWERLAITFGIDTMN